VEACISFLSRSQSAGQGSKLAEFFLVSKEKVICSLLEFKLINFYFLAPAEEL